MDVTRAKNPKIFSRFITIPPAELTASGSKGWKILSAEFYPCLTKDKK
jgi:hypothetical protein